MVRDAEIVSAMRCPSSISEDGGVLLKLSRDGCINWILNCKYYNAVYPFIQGSTCSVGTKSTVFAINMPHAIAQSRTIPKHSPTSRQLHPT